MFIRPLLHILGAYLLKFEIKIGGKPQDVKQRR